MRFTTRRHSPPSSLHHFAKSTAKTWLSSAATAVSERESDDVFDKLSDKVQVIIAPTPAAGHFIGSNLVGNTDGQAESQ
jgi:hypothetical protein